MSTAQHTPGPWRIREHDDRETLRIYDASGDFALCVHENAPLIAAAPELLAALEWYVETYAIPEADHKLGIPHLIEGEQAARAAIAKAKGQPSA